MVDTKNRFTDLKAPLPTSKEAIEDELIEIGYQIAKIESQIDTAQAKESVGKSVTDPEWKAKAKTALRLAKARYRALKIHLGRFPETAHPALEYALAFMETVEREWSEEDLLEIYASIRSKYPDLKREL